MSIAVVDTHVYTVRFQPFYILVHGATNRISVVPRKEDFIEGCRVVPKRVFTSNSLDNLAELGFGMISIPKSGAPALEILVAFRPDGWDWCPEKILTLLDYQLAFLDNKLLIKAERHTSQSLIFSGDSFTADLSGNVPQRAILKVAKPIQIETSKPVVIQASNAYGNFAPLKEGNFEVCGIPQGMILADGEYLVVKAPDASDCSTYSYVSYSR